MLTFTTAELCDWIYSRNKAIHVDINKVALDKCISWYYDLESGSIHNSDRTFFQIIGLRIVHKNHTVCEQPIILQNEIGYLGILRQRIGDEMYYLMQAKIEPGNVNKIQVSPTIQATKSNFTQRHGGKKPAYLDYFIHVSNYRVIVDQIQSEQSSRFLGKRNRNIIIEVNEGEDVEVLSSHRWMTMEQIKELMRYDNLVNMDTRTVLSCLPLNEPDYLSQIKDPPLYNSIIGSGKNYLPEIYQYINNYKMFDESRVELVRLDELSNWEMSDEGITCKEPYNFKVIYCDIEIEGREVRHWTQPLFEAAGIATFALLTRDNNGVKEFLIQAIPEVGCFDRVELGPSVQREYIHKEEKNAVDLLFDQHLKIGKGVKFDTLLSEEGGRFYHEQNRNIIMEIDKDELPELPGGYFWVDYRTLLQLIQINNCLNIQLRNLMSVLEW